MDRKALDKGNPYQRDDGGRSLHTYSPRSHEDLLRSHIQLDKARQGRLQNEVRRLTDENNRLRRELQEKDARIEALKGEPPKKPYSDKDPITEIDGKQVTLDDLLLHFNTILQRHHDLLNRKNNEIQKLQDLLNKKKVGPPKRDVGIQVSGQRDDEIMQQNLKNDFANQLAQVRYEYEQAEHILQDRNAKLESLIDELQRKLDNYEREINGLRQELAEREMNKQPTESTMNLIREMEIENNRLKDIIGTLKNEGGLTPTQGTDKELEKDIRNVIEKKTVTVTKIDNIIINLKSDVQTSETTNMSDLQNDCEKMLLDVNDMNDKLNKILIKLKQSGQPSDRNNVIPDLETVKQRCEDEIGVLKHHFGDGSPPSEHEIPFDGERRFDYVPSHTSTRSREPYSTKEGPVVFKDIPSVTYKDVTPVASMKHYPLVPCEACSETPLHVPTRGPAVLRKPPKSKSSKKNLMHEFFVPSERSKSKEKAKKKGMSCCAKQTSDTSNAPYKKCSDEKVVNTHSPYNVPENKKNLYPPIKKDNFSYEFPQRGRSPEINRSAPSSYKS